MNAKVVPLIVAGRMLLPLRFVTESPGATVVYNQTTKTIAATYPAY
ncbi:MAG: stalk domain-containing protein [Caldisericia bacterium]